MNRIKVLREYRGMSPKELAKAAEMNPLYLSQIECGRAPGGIGALTRLAAALGVEVEMIAPVTPPRDRDVRRSAR